MPLTNIYRSDHLFFKSLIIMYQYYSFKSIDLKVRQMKFLTFDFVPIVLRRKAVRELLHWISNVSDCFYG